MYWLCMRNDVLISGYGPLRRKSPGFRRSRSRSPVRRRRSRSPPSYRGRGGRGGDSGRRRFREQNPRSPVKRERVSRSPTTGMELITL